MQPGLREGFDLEATDLLNERTIDYTASPYKLKDTFVLHCMSVRSLDDHTQVTRYLGKDGIRKWIKERLPWVTELVAHNGIDYDLLALKLSFPGEFEYTIHDEDSHLCTINGREVRIVDTLVLSKVMNPDRYGGHSLDEWGKRLNFPKTNYRAVAVEKGYIAANAPQGAEFAKYTPEMGDYCDQDTMVLVKLYDALMEEWGDWAWEGPFSLEQRVRDIVTRQSHRGFWFNRSLAEKNIEELDAMMEEIRLIVEPLLPPKPMGVTKLKDYQPPKIQFKKNGDLSANIQKWVAKHEGTLTKDEADTWWAKFPFSEKLWQLPMNPEVAVATHEPATVKDTTHIKGWLVELGWRPTQYKERDLTCDSKKNKLSPEKFKETVKRYVEQTLNSPFCKDRCDELGVTPRQLENKLLKHDLKRPLKVYTNPTITVGMEKEIDPALVDFAEQNTTFPHAKKVSEYLTYAHRRNSILGGGFDPDDIDEDDEFNGKGFLAADRIAYDGRIPTPADSCGAGTSRFKHRLVANIPRVTSLYGKKMRALFGVDKDEGFIQLGYDFDSLEAKIEAHYVFRYEGGPEYGVSLTAEKPNDCHSVLARKISVILGREFPRSTAKNVKYGCSYNAQPPRVAKTIGSSLEDAQIIFDAFWEQAAPLKELKEKMQEYWSTTGQKKFLRGIDGRKLPIRSKGNVINTAFQSAGVICAKRAMVLHEKMLREEGLLVDFFRDDWQNKAKTFCQQLIAYHDEAQLEVKRSMVTWKKFESEEDCKKFRDSEKVWSDPVHTERGWFRGYCRAGELATIAVREAGKYYKLNVELSAGYMLGTTWGDCH